MFLFLHDFRFTEKLEEHTKASIFEFLERRSNNTLKL
ncbi:hypothetical protein AAZX31_03G065800 [Glycine max]